MPEITLLLDGAPVPLTVTREGDESVVRAGGHEHRIRLDPLEPGVLLLTAGGRSFLVHIAGENGRWALHMGGQTLEYEVEQAGEKAWARAYGVASTGPAARARDAVSQNAARTGPESEGLGAPMPGAVTHVLVHEGDAVSAGQPLVIVEAMKMEHVVRAPRAGVIKALRVQPGAQVEGGAIVAEIGPPASPPPNPPAR